MNCDDLPKHIIIFRLVSVRIEKEMDLKLGTGFCTQSLTVHDDHEALSSRHVRVAPWRRAIALTVSCWLPTAVTRVLSSIRSCGIYCGKKWHWSSFSLGLMFTFPTLIPPTALYSLIISDNVV
jgi:hypothetical protein